MAAGLEAVRGEVVAWRCRRPDARPQLPHSEVWRWPTDGVAADGGDRRHGVAKIRRLRRSCKTLLVISVVCSHTARSGDSPIL
nr:unnamed protein product [Digitaria exilis]